MTKRRGQTKPIHYLAALLILLLGGAISAFLLTRPAPAAPDSGEVQKQPVKEQPAHTVRFFDRGGQLLRTETVPHGEPVLPPVLSEPELILKKWDKPLHSVAEDMDVYPVYTAIGEEKNIVCTDAVYADTAQEFCITPRLAGTVDCSAFTIEIAYDSKLLTFMRGEAVLEGVQTECDEEKGVLTLRWSGESVLTQPGELTRLYFTCEETGSYQTNFPTVTKEIHTLQNGAQVYTDSVAYDGALFLSTNEKE